MGNCLSQAANVVQEVSASLAEQQQQGAGEQQPISSGGLSPVYDELPSGAEKHPVRNVYDGDTLTLSDAGEQRVRFLGIDTPEIKENQPFAQEAKAYTKNLCHHKDIWLTFESGGDKKDHYGRLLAFVWVPQGDKWLCVNEGIVAAGLATVYIPNQNSRLHNIDKFISLQKQARAQGRGMWASFNDYEVVKTANGAAYHKRSCKHIGSIRNLKELKASEAMDMGLHPCRTCLADA